MYCDKCKKEVTGPRYCGECGSEIRNDKLYDSAFGLWKVTTEGDDEGRTVKDLGMHIGWVDDIAFALSGACFYSLKFEKQKDLIEDYNSKNPPVASIVLDIRSGTWDMDAGKRIVWFKNFFRSRAVDVQAGQNYASVLIRRK